MDFDKAWYRYRKRDTEIVRRYRNGATAAQIGADPAIGLTEDGVRSVLTRRRIERRAPGRPPSVTALQVEEYREKGWTTRDIARAHGVTPQTIRSIECRARKKGLTSHDPDFT